MAAFIMSGPLQAIGFALGFALLAMFLPFLGLLSNAAIGLVALRMGWQRGAMIALAVSMGLGLVALLLQGNAFGSLLASLLQSLVVVAIGLSAIIMLALFNRAALLIDLIFVGLGLFLFQGIALVHSVRAQLNAHRTWLLALYLPLALLPVQTGLLVAVFGIVDTFADFRGYLARRTKQ